MNSADRRRLSSGIYAITPEQKSDDEFFIERIKVVLKCGISTLQYRCKNLPYSDRLNTAGTLRKICNEFRTPLIINDDVELALAIGADGVHLGQDDLDYRTLVSNPNRDLIVGISCYNSYTLACEGAAAGVDYIAFGSFFPSRTKPNAVRAEYNLLTSAKRELKVPIVAIGGITPENAPQLLKAGADLLAVISSIFDAPNTASSVDGFNQLFTFRKTHRHV